MFRQKESERKSVIKHQLVKHTSISSTSSNPEGETLEQYSPLLKISQGNKALLLKLTQNSHNDCRARLMRLFPLCHSQKVRANNSSLCPQAALHRHGVKENASQYPFLKRTNVSCGAALVCCSQFRREPNGIKLSTTSDSHPNTEERRLKTNGKRHSRISVLSHVKSTKDSEQHRCLLQRVCTHTYKTAS